jgi:ABC-type branched-subunit amino acid transport system ATPase component/ABC-type branched-subunit amino acid transport system permease subunit
VTSDLVFLLLGLANGAVYASLALGLVVTYRSSGVINFATAAVALFGADEYYYLRQGKLLLLVPGLPLTVGIGAHLGFAPALLAALAVCALLGLAMYGVIFRPLRNAPAVARAVASIGITVVITEVTVQRLGTSGLPTNSVFPGRVYVIGGTHVAGANFWFAGTVLVVTALLAAGFRFTRFGLHTRAAAETERGAYVSGISPDRIAACNWMISAAVAGLAGILVATIFQPDPVSYTLFIIPALAAAILGRFQNLVPAVIGGLAIGMIDSEMTNLQARHTWLPSAGLPDLVALVLILVVLVVKARPLPARGDLILRSLGRAPRPGPVAKPALLGIGVAVAALVITHGDWRTAIVSSLIMAIISLSLVVVTGYAGQVSLAQLTLAGVAGFTLSTLTVSWGIPFPIAPILAALVAMVVGVVVGLPALRIRGLPVAVVTLALAVTLQHIWFQNTDYVSSDGKNIKAASLFGLNLGVGTGAAAPRIGFCLMVLVFLVLVAIGVARLRTSRLGSAMLAVRANERSAAAVGIDVVRTKLAAFAIGAFIAGIGGSLMAYHLGNVTSDPFDVILGLSVFATVYLAGITSVSGGLLAGLLGYQGLVFLASSRWLHLGNWYNTITAIGLILTIVLNPEGLVGPVHERLAARRTKRSGRRPAGGATTPTSSRPSSSPADVATPARNPSLLSIRGVGVRFGGVVAVDNVDIDVAERTIVGLIGPNGAGKTTLIDAVSGFAPATGTVTLDGQRLDGLKPHQRIRTGLGRTFQAIELWSDLTVAENVLVGLSATAQRVVTTEDHPLRHTLELLGLDGIAELPAGELSQGQRQLVSIARALIGRPKVLLLDEPAGGLDTSESLWLGERLRDIRAAGTTILLVDHDMGLVLTLCDHIHVLDFGHVIATGTPAEIRANRLVAEAYLGTTHADVTTSP